jgi:hypothetical protein
MGGCYATHASALVETIKRVQTGTRQTQGLCGHAKVAGTKSLLPLVPKARKVLEEFVQGARALLIGHGHQKAFWSGQLKHRDLAGNVVASQVPCSESSEDEETDSLEESSETLKRKKKLQLKKGKKKIRIRGDDPSEDGRDSLSNCDEIESIDPCSKSEGAEDNEIEEDDEEGSSLPGESFAPRKRNPNAVNDSETNSETDSPEAEDQEEDEEENDAEDEDPYDSRKASISKVKRKPLPLLVDKPPKSTELIENSDEELAAVTQE